MKQHLFLLALLALTLSACGPVATSAPPAIPPTPSSHPAGEITSRPVTVTDALGRTLTFEALPRRIVVAGKATIMIVDALYIFPQAAEHVAAVALTGQGGNFFPILDPDAAAKTTLDDQAGPEQIAAAQPDLVILKSYLAEKLGAPIEALTIPVFYVSLETPEQYFSEIQALGQILGNGIRAQQVVDFYRQGMARVQKEVAGLTDDQKPSVLLIQHSAKGGETAYNVPPRQWIQTTLVEMAGGKPVWLDAQLGSGWTVVTLEQIAAWNPDKIFIVDYFDDPGKAVAAFRAEPVIQNLKAVQGDQVFAFPKDTYSWDQPDTRWILGLTWLAMHIHPDRFADVEIMAEFYTFYQTLYGLDRAAVDSQITPLLRGTLP